MGRENSTYGSDPGFREGFPEKARSLVEASVASRRGNSVWEGGRTPKN